MAAGPLMLDLEGPELTAEEEALLRHPMVGGVILFARNVRSREQVGELAARLGELRPELLLAVDQEGGRVQRLRDGFTRFPPMARLGALYKASPEEGAALLRDAGWLLAVEVLASGLDFSFAPVLDLDDHRSQVIGDRSFAPDPVVARGPALRACTRRACPPPARTFPDMAAWWPTAIWKPRWIPGSWRRSRTATWCPSGS